MIRALYCGECRQDWLLARASLREAGPSSAAIDLAWARTPEAARAAIRERSFDVVLLDSCVGEGDGLELLSDAASLLATTPILLLVRDDQEIDRMHQAFELGACDVLVRARVAPEDLRWAIQKACRHAGRPAAGVRPDPGGVLSGPATFRDRVDRALHRARRTNLSVAVLSVSVRPGDPGVDHSLHLGSAAERIRGCIRITDSLCRLGADCFLVLLEDLDDGAAAARVSERILEALGGAREPGGAQRLSGEIGIGLHPEDASSAEALVDSAKRALDDAMGPRSSRFWFSSRPLHRRAVRRSRVERALRRDLASMAFELHYQPRVELHTGSVVGAEALLRYSPRDLGPVRPCEIIPLLEEMEKIEAVGDWVLREACRVSAEWERLGHPIVVGVNVSAHQVEAGRLDRAVERALAETGASPELLELELTEGVLIENTVGTRRLLAGLRSRGVRIAVDDFGTGYASLRYVKHFPMDAIKIDREFVRGLPSDPENVAITSAIIALAHSLGIEVVAEGVEDPAEEAFLREQRCDYVQGFLRARPMPAAQVVPWLRRRPPALSEMCVPAVAESGGGLGSGGEVG